MITKLFATFEMNATTSVTVVTDVLAALGYSEWIIEENQWVIAEVKPQDVPAICERVHGLFAVTFAGC